MELRDLAAPPGNRLETGRNLPHQALHGLYYRGHQGPGFDQPAGFVDHDL